MSKWPITEEPGRCGSCKHFKRWEHRDGSPMARGKCAIKPERWDTSQTIRACKRYEPKGDA